MAIQPSPSGHPQTGPKKPEPDSLSVRPQGPRASGRHRPQRRSDCRRTRLQGSKQQTGRRRTGAAGKEQAVVAEVNYGNFMHGLMKENIQLNRKVLSELSMHEPYSFKALVDVSRNAFLGNRPPVKKEGLAAIL